MKNLISEQYRHLLYKDECNDQFLLLKNMEIYRKSETILKVICWSYKIYSQLKKEGVIFNEWETDEKLYSFETDNPILPHLFATGSHSRRIFKNGRWLNNKEKRLGHRIYPFNPKID